MRYILGFCALLALGACEADPCGSPGLAKTMAEKFVKRELRDPDSAKFHDATAERSSEDACSYLVKGRYSATNGFGGKTQGGYIVEMRKKRGENAWSAHDLIVQ